MDALTAACLEAEELVRHIDSKIREKLLKRARRQGMTNEHEVIELVEAWKHAASTGCLVPLRCLRSGWPFIRSGKRACVR